MFSSFVNVARDASRRFNELSRIRQALIALVFGTGMTLTLIASLVPVLTNSLSVEPSIAADNKDHVVTYNDLRPAACSAINIAAIVSGGGGGSPTGGAGNDLVLADTSTTSMGGGDGDDCIVAGSDQTTIDGGNGNDVCFGDPAKMTNCEDPEPLP
jgi:hypothetical protein